MSVVNLGPLDWRIPIVTPDGRPTAEFQRRWANQIGNNSQIGSITLGSGIPPALPLPADGAMYADTSTNPYTIYIASGGVWNLAGVIGANPTAVASDTAVNGSALTFMRSDAAPAIQLATDSQFGIVQVDGTTITESGGVISAVGGGGSGFFSGGQIVQGGILSSAFATHGMVFTALKAFTIEGFNVRQQISVGNTYRIFIATVSALTLDAAGENLTGTGTTFGTEIASQVFTSPTTGAQFINITLSSPVAITAGNSYTIGIQRTDSTGTAISQSAYFTTQMPSMLNTPGVFYRRLWNSNVAPGVNSLNGVTTTSIDGGTATGIWMLPWGYV